MMLVVRLVIASLVASRVVGLECSLCGDGSPLPFPDTTIIPNTSCQELADTFNETETVDQCYAIQVTGGVYCGCNNTVVAEGACRICGDGTLLPFPSLFSKDDAVSCAELEFDANLIENDCTGYQNQFRGICCSPEIPVVTPAPVAIGGPACPLCEDGSAIPNPNFFPIRGVDCFSLQEQYADIAGSDCVAAQATYGVYCGCSNPNASEGICRVCGGDTLLPNATQWGNRDPFFPVACSEVEYEANTQGDCQGYRAQFADRCSCPATPMPSEVPSSAPVTSAPVSLAPAVTNTSGSNSNVVSDAPAAAISNNDTDAPGSATAPASSVTSGIPASAVLSRTCVLLVAAALMM